MAPRWFRILCRRVRIVESQEPALVLAPLLPSEILIPLTKQCCMISRFGNGDWTPELRTTYNLFDPVVRSTVQVYPGGWTSVYAFLDNPGMWNLRSQLLKNWFLGQELYIRVHDSDPNPAKERLPRANLLFCGSFNFHLTYFCFCF